MDVDFVRWLPIGMGSAFFLMMGGIARIMFRKQDENAAQNAALIEKVNTLSAQVALELRAMDVRIAVIEAHLQLPRRV